MTSSKQLLALAWPVCFLRPLCCGGIAVFLCASPCFAQLAAPANAQPANAQPANAQQLTANLEVKATGEASEIVLSFAFERAPWRDVIKWIADQSGLALHYEDLPTGSFSYSDPRQFTVATALDRLNLFLLPQGFTLVRSGQLLSLINLADPRSLQQLDALATLVSQEQLDQREDHEVVKCMFALGELTIEDAVEELSALKLMTNPAPFHRTNQLLVTDTVAKLKSVLAIISAFQPQGLGNGSVMKSFALQHATAEDILLVARPHLGLATGEMIGIDVSLSADPKGEHIFVTGSEDRVKLLDGLVQALDQPQAQVGLADGSTELRSHLVTGGNVELVYNVLQTLLAGKSLRLSMDPAANSIVALATPDVHSEIEQTVVRLQAAEADFEVVHLKNVDPYFAITLIEEMLELDYRSSSSSRGRNDSQLDLPKIDADPGNRRLYVRGKPHQIAQIKKIVAGLDNSAQATGSDLRVFPLRGKEAERTLETAAKFWRKANPIVLYPATETEDSSAVRERIVGQEDPQLAKFVTVSDQQQPDTTPRYLTDNLQSAAPIIRCQLTARGLLLQSDDTQALDEFEQHLLSISGPTDKQASPPVVFYLQYTKPEDALRMLAELLDGGQSAKEGEAGTLVNGYVSSSGSFLGSIVAARDGTLTMMAGTITVVADPRLNRLIAQGTSQDMEQIESYLAIIDKDSSIADVRTYGRSQVIELRYTKASQVAEAIRGAFAGRVAAAAPASGQGTGQGQGAAPAAPTAGDDRARRDSEGSDEDKKAASAKKSSTGATARNLEPTMTLAIHEPSNSLIVTAPDKLVDEVRELVSQIDSRSEQTVEILAADSTAVLQAILQQGSGGSRENGRSSNSSSRSSSSSSSSNSQLWEMLRSRSGR
jgi:type II secretory pathway component GspD/PulD (secretin)